MPNKAINMLKNFLATLLNNMLASLLVVIILGTSVVSWLAGKTSALIRIAKTPTPLWATIVLILLVCLYTSVKHRKPNQTQKPPSAQKLGSIQEEKKPKQKKKWPLTSYGKID